MRPSHRPNPAQRAAEELARWAGHARAWLDQRWPSQCVLCRAWPTPPVCEPCMALLAAPVPRCPGCALALPPGQACRHCQRHPSGLHQCLATLDYVWPWTELVARWKFRQQPMWGRWFGQLMRADDALAEALDEADWVLPMPSPWQRLGERGYAPAWQLVQALCPGALARKRVRQGLLHLGAGAPQHQLSRSERLLNLQHRLLPDPLWAAQLRERQVLLIDDVMTTGASLEAAAAPLLAAGARSVSAAVLARTPDPRAHPWPDRSLPALRQSADAAHRPG